jgi:predicted transcriptional regulator
MTWKEHKEEMLKDPKFKQAYDDLEPAYEIAKILIQARLDKKLTQRELAIKAGVAQDTIAMLEGGTANPTITTVSRVARVVGKELRLVDAVR